MRREKRGFTRGEQLAIGVASLLVACAPPPQTDVARSTADAVALNPANTYVQLFKWRWTDIAKECTQFLGPNGFGAVQISPPQAHITSANTWWDMYQPTNYVNLVGDMGTASQLQDMIN